AHLMEAPFGAALLEGQPASGGLVLEANAAFSAMFGAGAGSEVAALFPEETVRAIAACVRSRARRGGPPPSRIEARLPGPEERAVHLYVRPIGGSGRKRRSLIYVMDATERKQIEAQYAQAQKMSAVGQLAGGVAHDFNNILTVIMGNCDALMTRHAVGDPSYPFLVEIQQSASRAAGLVRKLLAFSRKQTLQPIVLSITDVLQDFSPFLRRTLTEKVSLELVNGRDLRNVKADRLQLETAIMNLAVNARDAMAAGGVVKVSTRLITESQLEKLGYSLLGPGDYVMIEVADSGEGIAPEIVDKIFDPFFTTKEAGKGTGLGLSTVYGIVKQTGGHIFVESEPGKGAAFRILLPAYEGDEAADAGGVRISEGASETGVAPAKPAAPVKREAPVDLTGRGKLLVVEDEDPVRKVVVSLLQSRGYEVMEADDGETALELIEENQGHIDLLISDVMMPGMDGPTLVTKARDMLGEAKIIFISGYAEGAMREQLADFENIDFLPKPFTLKTLSAKVKEVLTGE
ncbi:MAG: response regulator, partial [Pseudomonadota bacterium]